MADSNTTLYKLVKPEVGASADTWGSKTNADWDSVDKLLGAITTAGSANAYTLTTGQSLAAYATGQRFRLKLSFSNTGSATLNVDSIGAKTIKKRDASTNVSSGDLASGAIVTVTYDGTNFVLETNLASDLSFQPLDATLTAFAAQTTGADLLWYWTGTDAGTTMSLPSASRTQIAAGLGTAALVADGTSGAAYGKLNANLTFSGTLTYTGGVFIPTSAFAAIGTLESASGKGFRFAQTGSGADSIVMQTTTNGFAGVTATPLTITPSTGALAFAARPTFNGNTALDTNNGAQLGASNTFTSAQYISANVPQLYLVDADGAANNKNWNFQVNSGALVAVARDDAFAGAIAFTLNRSGATPTNLTMGSGVELILDSAAPTSDLSAGFRRFTPTAATSGTFVAADSGKTIYASGGVTVPNSVFSKGDSYGILAGGSSRAITQGSGVTLTNGNTGATGSVTLAANGFATVIHTSASAATVFGNV